MYKTNKSSPRIDPCGTPIVTLREVTVRPLETRFSVLPAWWSQDHLMDCSSAINKCSLNDWLTESKVCHRSIKTSSTAWIIVQGFCNYFYIICICCWNMMSIQTAQAVGCYLILDREEELRELTDLRLPWFLPPPLPVGPRLCFCSTIH